MVFENALETFLLLAFLVVVGMVGILVIGGYIYPLLISSSFLPSNSSALTPSMYESISSRLWERFNWFWVIILAIPFIFIIIKILYEKEEITIIR
jgi:hypothetical protein